MCFRCARNLIISCLLCWCVRHPWWNSFTATALNAGPFSSANSTPHFSFTRKSTRKVSGSYLSNTSTTGSIWNSKIKEYACLYIVLSMFTTQVAMIVVCVWLPLFQIFLGSSMSSLELKLQHLFQSLPHLLHHQLSLISWLSFHIL